MRTRKIKLYIILIAAVAASLALVYYVRPPGVAPPSGKEHNPYIVDFINEGELPGVTWADDIHPIFTRNVCIRCHTRGEEAVAEGFEEFALGLVDPDDKKNAFWSYHELVYAEGPPEIQQGEINRDGQCCWPRDFPAAHQRRIWIGHPERSAIMRKLDRDYYDWRNPPRFFEEALDLPWGLPMPMYAKLPVDDDTEGEQNASHVFYYKIRPFYERMLLHLRFWAGGGKDELRTWPPRISASDRALLRYWINNSMQVTSEGTGIEVEVLNASGAPVKDAVVRLVGNYNSSRRKAVSDIIAMETDSSGLATISFPQNSVLSSEWYVSAEKDGITTRFRPIELREGTLSSFKITLRDEND
jgi:hypothetical protein